MAHSILSNTAIASFGRVCNLLIGISVTAVVTRLLGVEEYGVYAVLLSYGMALQMVADFGLYLTLAKEIGRNEERRGELISSITSLRVLLLLISFAGGLGILLFFPGWDVPLLPYLVIAAGLSFQSLSQLLMGVYQTYGVVWRATVGDVVGRSVQLAGVLAYPFLERSDILHVPFSEITYVALVFTGGVVVSYGIHAALLPAFRRSHMSFSVYKWREIAHASWPLGVLLVLNIVYFRIDILMLSVMRQEYEVGIYGLAYKIIESGLFFPAMLGGMLLPRLSLLLKRKHIRHATSLLGQSLYIVFVVAVICCTLLFLFAHPIVTFLSGDEFREAAAVLRVLTVAMGVMFVGNMFGFSLVALGRQKQLLALYVVLAAGNIALNAFFIPLYGMYAAAWTTIATEVTAMLVAGGITYTSLSWSIPLWGVVRVAVAAGIAVAVAFVVPSQWHIIVQVLAVLCVYGAATVMVGALRMSHIHMLLSHENV